ncbi:hypothetical protein ABIB50_003371 [Mucilaginibacter sp. UYCu711]
MVISNYLIYKKIDYTSLYQRTEMHWVLKGNINRDN